MLLAIGNLVYPGCGLVLRDRLLAGGVLVGAATLALAAAVLAPLIASSAFLGQLLLISGAGYGLCAAIAGALWWWWERPSPLNREAVLTHHRLAAAAWLRDDHATARSEAAAVCAAAPGMAGSWHLLAMVEQAAGDSAAARRAHAKALELERRAAERTEAL